MHFHFHEGTSQGGTGDAPLYKGTFWMLELASVCHDHHTHPGAAGRAQTPSGPFCSFSHGSNWAGQAEEVQVWAHL